MPPKDRKKYQEENKIIPCCWNCGSKTISNPKAYEEIKIGKNEHAFHPAPNHSFYCENCEYDVISCACKDGKRTQCEWFYTLGELWEDLNYCKVCDIVTCQSCEAEHKCKHIRMDDECVIA